MRRVNGCVLAGITPCGGGLSREHYISAAVLKLIFGADVGNVSGTPWAPTTKGVPISALTGRYLCEQHNHGLSPLDNVGAGVVKAIQDAQLELEAGSDDSWDREFDGLQFERWLVKVALGMWASGNFAMSGVKLPGAPPARWKRILTSTGTFPRRQGVHMLRNPYGPFMTAATEMSVMPLSVEDEIKIVDVELARTKFRIALSHFERDAIDYVRRPAALCLQQGATRKQIVLDWSGHGSEEAIFMTRIGDARPPPA